MNMIERAKAYSILNRWGWDSKLGNTPKGFRDMGMDERCEIIYPIIQEIKRTTPKVVIQYYWIKSEYNLSGMNTMLFMLKRLSK